MGGYFVVGTVITLVGLAVVDELGWDEARWGALLTPAAILGFRLGGPLLPVVDRGYTRPAILLFSSVSALVLLARALF